jgi:hypothetical protein
MIQLDSENNNHKYWCIYLAWTTALALGNWVQDTIEYKLYKLTELVGASCCCISKRCDILVHSHLKKERLKKRYSN